jgi:hypothetical protein
MKKILLLIAVCLLSSVAFAQKISVKGKLDVLASEKEAGVVFTYNDMRVGKDTETEYVERKVAEYNEKEPGRGDAWLEAWTYDRESRYEPKFLELWDKYMEDDSKKGGFTLNPLSEDSKYVFSVNTNFTEPGFNVGVMRRNASISLDITVTERATGAEIARITVANSSANSFFGDDFESGYRIQECYAKAGRELALYRIKSLKLSTSVDIPTRERRPFWAPLLSFIPTGYRNDCSVCHI